MAEGENVARYETYFSRGASCHLGCFSEDSGSSWFGSLLTAARSKVSDYVL